MQRSVGKCPHRLADSGLLRSYAKPHPQIAAIAKELLLLQVGKGKCQRHPMLPTQLRPFAAMAAQLPQWP